MNAITELIEAAKSGSLLTLRHNPNDLSITYDKTCSVLTPTASSSLENFIVNENYDLQQYDDARYPNGRGLCVFHPTSGSNFVNVGSFVPSGSITPSGSLDCLVAVYGPRQGWHVYADDFSSIDAAVTDGRLSLNTVHNKSGSFS